MWFAESKGGRIGRITTDGKISEFPLLRPDATPWSIVAGPDGALWFVENPGNAVARIGVDGRIREFLLPEPDRYPNAIGVGPDGALFGGSARAASAA